MEVHEEGRACAWGRHTETGAGGMELQIRWVCVVAHAAPCPVARRYQEPAYADARRRSDRIGVPTSVSRWCGARWCSPGRPPTTLGDGIGNPARATRRQRRLLLHTAALA